MPNRFAYERSRYPEIAELLQISSLNSPPSLNLMRKMLCLTPPGLNSSRYAQYAFFWLAKNRDITTWLHNDISRNETPEKLYSVWGVHKISTPPGVVLLQIFRINGSSDFFDFAFITLDSADFIFYRTDFDGHQSYSVWNEIHATSIKMPSRLVSCDVVEWLSNFDFYFQGQVPYSFNIQPTCLVFHHLFNISDVTNTA